MEERILARLEAEECASRGSSGPSGVVLVLLVGVLVLVAAQKMPGTVNQWRTR
jgi:hypothetical protein